MDLNKCVYLYSSTAETPRAPPAVEICTHDYMVLPMGWPQKNEHERNREEKKNEEKRKKKRQQRMNKKK